MLNSAKRSISLGARLILIVVVLVTLILTGIGALQYSRTETLYTKLVDEGLSAACTRMSRNLAGPLWNFNKEQTGDVLQSELAQDAVAAIAVRMGTDVKVFAGARKVDHGKAEPLTHEGALPKTLFRRDFEVPWEDNIIATGSVYYTLDSLKQTLHTQVISTVVQTLVADLLLIVLIGLVLSSIVIRPLSSLTTVGKSVVAGNFEGNVVARAASSLVELATRLHRDELRALTDTFNNMLVNLQARDAELEGHRQNLERLVAERTAALSKRNEEMRLVLDNVDQGLVIVATDGTLSDERSAAFTRFFDGSEAKADACIFEDPKARAYFRLGFEQVVDNFMPIDVVLEQLPKRSRRGSSVFGLRYRPLMEGEECRSVLFMIDDITEELLAQQKDIEQFEQIRVFERWMRDRNGFIEFFNEARKLVKRVHDDDFESPAERLRVIHTVKGNAALFDVLSVAEVAHDLESLLVDGEVEKAAAQQMSLVLAWDSFAKRVGLLIGEDMSERFELSRPELNDIITGLRGGEPTRDIVHRLVAITFEPMKLRFARIEQQLSTLGSRLGKAPMECVTLGDQMRLPPDRFAAFWGVFPHVVRNIADHGFETVEERERAGKPARNRVTLGASSDAQTIELSIADDGHGIDWTRVAEKAKALGMPHGTRRDQISALFSPGFSTAKEVTAMSGRGVGLSAIAIEVSLLGGSVTVESEVGKGTLFRFSFPQAAQSDSRISIVPVSMAPISSRS